MVLQWILAVMLGETGLLHANSPAHFYLYNARNIAYCTAFLSGGKFICVQTCQSLNTRT